MKTNTLFAALLAAISLASAGSATAVERSPRYRTVAETPRSEEMRVLRTGNAWVEGMTGRGERLTVVFDTRFASVRRGNERVPVSYLRAGDRIAVTGVAGGGRLHAISAADSPARTVALP